MNESQDRAGGASSEGEILKANVLGPDQVRVGMEVTSLDGERIGRVKEVSATEFLLDRSLARDLWVPFDVVIAAEGHGDGFTRTPPTATDVVLNVSAAHVGRQGWREA